MNSLDTYLDFLSKQVQPAITNNFTGCLIPMGVGVAIGGAANAIGHSILPCERDSLQSTIIRLTSTVLGTAAGAYAASRLPIRSFTITTALALTVLTLPVAACIKTIAVNIFGLDKARVNKSLLKTLSLWSTGALIGVGGVYSGVFFAGAGATIYNFPERFERLFTKYAGSNR